VLVQEVMTTRLTAIPAEMSITRAAEAMKARDVGLSTPSRCLGEWTC